MLRRLAMRWTLGATCPTGTVCVIPIDLAAGGVDPAPLRARARG